VTIGELAAWIGGAIFVARLSPQPIKLWRHRNEAGVSWLAAVNTLTTTLGWTIYGLGVDEFVIWFPTLFAFVPEVATIALLGVRPSSRRDARLAALWLTAVLVAWPLGGRAGLGAVMAVGVLAGVVPQVLTALTSNDLSGLAKRTWHFALVDAALWGTYAASVADLAIGFYAIVLLTGAVVILVRLRVAERRSEPAVRLG
jgi:uncharacterized protein with PQ loop repeat